MRCAMRPRINRVEQARAQDSEPDSPWETRWPEPCLTRCDNQEVKVQPVVFRVRSAAGLTNRARSSVTSVGRRWMFRQRRFRASSVALHFRRARSSATSAELSKRSNRVRIVRQNSMPARSSVTSADTRSELFTEL